MWSSLGAAHRPSNACACHDGLTAPLAKQTRIENGWKPHILQVSELEPLLATAERLGLRVSLMLGTAVACCVTDTQSWAQPPCVAGLVHVASLATAAARVPLTRLPCACPVQLESLPILRGMLAGFRHWEAGARAITQVDGFVIIFATSSFHGVHMSVAGAGRRGRGPSRRWETLSSGIRPLFSLDLLFMVVVLNLPWGCLELGGGRRMPVRWRAWPAWDGSACMGRASQNKLLCQAGAWGSSCCIVGHLGLLRMLTPPIHNPGPPHQDASGTPLKPSFAVLAQASSSAKSWPITSPVRAFIDEAVARTGGLGLWVGSALTVAALPPPSPCSPPSLAPHASRPCCPVLSGDWMERCRKLLAKRNTGARLDVCLDAVAASVDGAVEQFERRLDVSRRVHCSLWAAHDGALAGVPGSVDGAVEQVLEQGVSCWLARHSVVTPTRPPSFPSAAREAAGGVGAAGGRRRGPCPVQRRRQVAVLPVPADLPRRHRHAQ